MSNATLSIGSLSDPTTLTGEFFVSGIAPFKSNPSLTWVRTWCKAYPGECVLFSVPTADCPVHAGDVLVNPTFAHRVSKGLVPIAPRQSEDGAVWFHPSHLVGVQAVRKPDSNLSAAAAAALHAAS